MTRGVVRDRRPIRATSKDSGQRPPSRTGFSWSGASERQHLERQYCQFAGIAHGQKTTNFIKPYVTVTSQFAFGGLATLR